MHCLTISACETVSQFIDNLRTQFNEGKGYQGIRTFKTFEFKNIQVTPKNIELTEKKKNNMRGKSYIPTRGIYRQNHL